MLNIQKDWKAVSLPALTAWTLFFVAFLVYAFRNTTGFLFLDSANLVVHEAGHLLFGWFGYSIGIWGGTLLQWLVPLLLASAFFHRREPIGFAFCLFVFFENWLYTAAYMADATSMTLPLVTVGDPDGAVHDWHFIFSQLGVLPHDTAIATITRAGGWIGMLAVVAWLGYRYSQKPAPIPALR